MTGQETGKPRLLVLGDPGAFDLESLFELQVARDAAGVAQAISAWQPDLLLLANARDDPAGSLVPVLDLAARQPQLKLVLLDAGTEQFSLPPAVFAVLPGEVEPERLTWTLQLAVEHARRERGWAKAPGSRQPELVEGMLGESEAMQACIGQLQRLARVDTTILVQGESGTGKEMLVRALHHLSARRKGPLVAINCAAIPEALLESELFGYERGAFTGAYESTAGRIEKARGGILFLDEVGDLPLPIQAKLLRFLQEREIERLGGQEPIPVDTRVICATHRDLQQQVSEGLFRSDLLYRLDETRLEVPPLHQRHGDILLLAREFLRCFAREQGRLVRGFSQQAEVALEAHDWPGNVRELENRVRRALVMSEGLEIDCDTLQLAAPEESELKLKSVRERAEREAIIKALALSDYNLSHAAKLLGVARPTLYALLERLGISI